MSSAKIRWERCSPSMLIPFSSQSILLVMAPWRHAVKSFEKCYHLVSLLSLGWYCCCPGKCSSPKHTMYLLPRWCQQSVFSLAMLHLSLVCRAVNSPPSVDETLSGVIGWWEYSDTQLESILLESLSPSVPGCRAAAVGKSVGVLPEVLQWAKSHSIPPVQFNSIQ